ncbi:unnamed protein product [Calypogeia fissa]
MSTSMPGVRCGARLRQRMEIQLVKQLGCRVGCLAVVPNWRTIRVLAGEGKSCVFVSQGQVRPDSHIFGNPQSRRYSPISLNAAAGLIHGKHSLSPLNSSHSSLVTPHISAIKSRHLETSFEFLSSSSCSSAGPLVWGHPSGSTHQQQPFNKRNYSASRIALAPRVAPELPETGQSWLESQRLCPGCGIEMQDEDPKAPGFFQRPVVPVPNQELLDEEDVFTDAELLNLLDRPDGGVTEMEDGLGSKNKKEGVLEWVDISSSPEEINLEEDWGKDSRRGRRGKRGKRGKLGQDKNAEDESESEKPVVCARCHALRNYGKVKDEDVENLLPDFDFEYVVGSRLRKAIGRRAVVLMVIDSVDFDGSFPRMAASILADAERELGKSWQEGKAANVPRLVIVLNKVDLLPGQLSPVRLEQWARRRSRAGGVTQISGVHIVSAFKGWGLDKLSKQITEMAGPRGDVWVIGAQNVGKSSLINGLGKLAAKGSKGGADGRAEGKKANAFLTEAAVPGTTVGVLKLEGILPGKARLLDTPGLLHPHQITTRLTREEQKMVQIRKVLKPRTFRVKVGHAITLGGLVQVHIKTAPGESIYATIWASPHITCHMGKGETAQDLFDKHIGDKLQPPMTKERLDELGRWVSRTVDVSGDRWDKSSMDVAVAGIGWIGFAVSGSSRLEVWTYEGVAVTVRDAMVLDLAPVMERPGFTAVKASAKGKD